MQSGEPGGGAAKPQRASPREPSSVDAAGLEIVIARGTPDDAWEIAGRIAEFDSDAERYERSVYRHRLTGDTALVLVARVADEPIGFKAGYDRFQDGSWYSWMGGVRKSWRGQGVAQQLLDAQERWVAAAGFRMLYVKTRNRHKRMIAFLAMNRYDVLRVEEKSSIEESRVLFCKPLSAAAAGAE